MKIGLVTVYAYRPHVEHLAYLSHLLRSGGHSVTCLTCDSGVPDCYTLEMRGFGKLRECPKCIAGGVRSYPLGRIYGMRRRFRSSLSPEALQRIAASSSFTLHRTESAADTTSAEVRATRERLYPGIEIAYANTRAWIDREQLDAIICFNGRMEMTRAITYACEEAGLPYLTLERTWLGHGLQLIPNANCLSLQALNAMAETFRDIPLTEPQARLAGQLAAERFLQRNDLEWRLYNPYSVPVSWPGSGNGEKVLILPSSHNEFDGHPDWGAAWSDYTEPMERLLHERQIKPSQCVLRCHPNWAERIGRRTGERSERHYIDWAKRMGIPLIRSAERASTYALLDQADLVILNGSTSGIEAALLGKPVICTGHAAYEQGGFSVHVNSDKDWWKLNALESHNPVNVSRLALRHLYLRANRFPQYVNYVRALTTTKYYYIDGADPNCLIRMLRTGRIEPDDATEGFDTTGEDGILEAMARRDWANLIRNHSSTANLPRVTIQRRFGLRWIDQFRTFFPRGDL